MRRFCVVLLLGLTACGTSDPVTGPDGAGDGAVADAAKVSCEADKDCATGPCAGARCVEGTCTPLIQPDGTPCEDADPCTVGTTCAEGVCGGGKDGCGCTKDADCAALGLDDACLGKLRCDTDLGGRCVRDEATRVTCKQDDDPCTSHACDPAKGACVSSPAQDGKPCEDGDPCTSGSACAAGACSGGEGVCPCATSADCAHLQAKDWRCSGAWYCDVSGESPTCKLNPASVVTCDTSEEGGCVVGACDPADGTCGDVTRPDKSACDDNNPCTGNDTCAKGVCQGKDNICTCVTDADCAKQDDGDKCTGTLYCDTLGDSPTCKVLPGSPVVCDTSADGSCRKTACEPKTGKCQTSDLDGATCEDGNPCTKSGSCKGGGCTPGANTCPCTVDADCAAKNPADKCLGTLYCDQSSKTCAINPATVVVCPSAGDGPCERNVCDAKTGTCAMAPRPDDSTCDADGNPCTQGDVCKAGKCLAGPNVCACQKSADCAKYDDGNVCNGALFCDPSKLPLRCEVNPATVVSCPSVDNTACQERRCEPSTGACPLVAVNELAACDADGSSCTAGDRCQEGACVAGTNTCACLTDKDCAKQEDGDLCNGTLYCDKSAQPFVCAVNPKTVVSCAGTPTGPCQEASCVPLSGACTVVALQDNLPCDDGEVCTSGDVCEGGACKPGKNLCACQTDAQCAGLNPPDKCDGVYACDTSVVPHVCAPKPGSKVVCPDGGGPCFDWGCKDGACVKAAKPDAQSCDDADPCTPQTSCKSGACEGAPKVCDDKDVCTIDSCDPKSGKCVHKATDGLPCTDGDACTVLDLCEQGACKPGPKLPCDDAEDCTTDTCDKTKGCVHDAVKDDTPCSLPDGATATCEQGLCGLAP